jgi:hypothetical protein
MEGSYHNFFLNCFLGDCFLFYKGIHYSEDNALIGLAVANPLARGETWIK